MLANDDQELQDRRVAALLGDGVSFRQVAALLGLSLGAVQRAARRARSARSAGSATDDPILESLAPAEAAYLGLSAEVVAAGELSRLDRYRILSLPAGSAAGDAAREMFDHGRGGEAFDAWMQGRESF